MRVKVIAEMLTSKAIIPPGRIIEIPAAIFARLAGKVETVDLFASHSARDLQSVKLKLVPKRWNVGVPGQDRQEVTASPVEISREGLGHATPPCCRCCSSTNIWTTFQGDTRCRRCHPPAPGAERSSHHPS